MNVKFLMIDKGDWMASSFKSSFEKVIQFKTVKFETCIVLWFNNGSTRNFRICNKRTKVLQYHICFLSNRNNLLFWSLGSSNFKELSNFQLIEKICVAMDCNWNRLEGVTSWNDVSWNCISRESSGNKWLVPYISAKKMLN